MEENKEQQQGVNEEDKNPQEPSQDNSQGQEPEQNKEPDYKDIKDEEGATEFLKKKGFDYSKLQEEYNANGDISKETRKELVEAGIEESFIDDYIEIRKTKQAQAQEEFINELAKGVGGREQLQQIYSWATDHLSKDELAGLNEIKGLAACKLVIESLKMRMDEAEGVIPEMLSGNSGSNDENLYRYKEQLMEDISNPKYDKDPSFRERVRLKIAASKKAGYLK